MWRTQKKWNNNNNNNNNNYSIECSGLFPEEQKGCHKETKEADDLLYIDEYIPKKVKIKREISQVVFVDYEKSYDTVPQTWIIECLKMFIISEKVINFMKATGN